MRCSAIASTSSTIVRPWNGRVPYSASYSATQKLNWSAAGVAASPRNCSGAMYAGVPITAPLWVVLPEIACSSECSAGASDSDDNTCSRTRPRSSTRTTPSSPRIALAGLKSRCTKPWACSSARPRPAW